MMELNWIDLTMEFEDMSRFFTKVWNCRTLPKLSRGVSKLLSRGEDLTDKCLNFTQYESSSKEQETDGTCPQTNCYAEPKTQGKERNDDSYRVVQEKSHCAGNEEMSNSVGKNHKFSNLADLESKQRKIVSDSIYIAAVCVLLLMYLPPGQGAALGNTPAIYCGSYFSNLSNSSGPWNQSMCSSELEKIHCQTGQISRCVPFIPGDFFACCIEDPKGYTFKDGECILVTQIGGSNKKVAQCYGKEYCSPPAATSTPTNLKSTKNPLTPNVTNDIEALQYSPNKSTGQNCHENCYEKTTMAAPSTTQKTIERTTGAGSSLGDGGSGSGSEAGVVVAVVIILIIVGVVLVVGVVFYKKNLFGFKDKLQRITDICRRTRFQQNNNTGQDVETGDPPEQAQPMIPHVLGNGDTELETQSVAILPNG